MLGSADDLRDFECFQKATWYTPPNSEQRNVAVEGMLHYVKGDRAGWARAPIDQAPLYIETLRYTIDGSEQQNHALASFSECLAPFTPIQKLEVYRDLARAFAYDTAPWKFGVENQLETIKTLPHAQMRLAKLQSLRSLMAEPISIGYGPETPTTVLNAAGELILDDMIKLPSPRARVATAQRLLQGESSYLFAKDTQAYKDEIKLRTTAEKIIVANGVLPLPDPRAGSRLMAILDRDDVSHAVYMTTQAIKAAKKHLGALCNIDRWNAPTAKPNTIANSSEAHAIESATSPVLQLPETAMSDAIATAVMVKQSNTSTAGFRARSSSC